MNGLTDGGLSKIVEDKWQIEIYLDDGRVFSYEVASAEKVREHAAAIIKDGYRHSDLKLSTWEWYPAYRILKVKSKDIPTNYYTLSVRGT